MFVILYTLKLYTLTLKSTPSQEVYGSKGRGVKRKSASHMQSRVGNIPVNVPIPVHNAHIHTIHTIHTILTIHTIHTIHTMHTIHTLQITQVFQRTRPTYAEQGTFYSVIGECFSFPSGHTMRAFYVAFWLNHSLFVKSLDLIQCRARDVLPWAIGVGIARVAKGRHYPLDVAVGAVVGSLLGHGVENVLDGPARTVFKTVCGIYIVLNWGWMVVVPIVNSRIGLDYKKWTNKITTAIAFYLFASILLIMTIAPSWTMAGAQSLLVDKTSSSVVCKTFW